MLMKCSPDEMLHLSCYIHQVPSMQLMNLLFSINPFACIWPENDRTAVPAIVLLVIGPCGSQVQLFLHTNQPVSN